MRPDFILFAILLASLVGSRRRQESSLPNPLASVFITQAGAAALGSGILMPQRRFIFMLLPSRPPPPNLPPRSTVSAASGLTQGARQPAITGLLRAQCRPSFRSWEWICPGEFSCTLHFLALCKDGGKPLLRPFLVVPKFKAVCVGPPHFSACSAHHTAAIQAQLGGRVHTTPVNTLTIMAEMYFIVVPQFCSHPPKPQLLHFCNHFVCPSLPSLSLRLLLKNVKNIILCLSTVLGCYIHLLIRSPLTAFVRGFLLSAAYYTEDFCGKNAKQISLANSTYPLTPSFSSASVRLSSVPPSS